MDFLGELCHLRFRSSHIHLLFVALLVWKKKKKKKTNVGLIRCPEKKKKSILGRTLIPPQNRYSGSKTINPEGLFRSRESASEESNKSRHRFLKRIHRSAMMAIQAALRSITVPCSTSYSCDPGLRSAATVPVRACRSDSMVMTDHHSVLGVRRNASRNEIKRAYRRLARLYHPDVCKDRGTEQRFKQINRAYESIIKEYTRFQPETGFVCSIEDLFKSAAESEAVPDIFSDGDWFEGLNFNNASYHHPSFMHEIMDEEAFKVTDVEEDQHKKCDESPAWMQY